MVIAVLSLAGFFVAFYMLAHSLGWTGPLICGVGDCATVQSSKYAKIGPVPVSVFGLVGYALMFGTAFLGIQPGRRDSASVSRALVGLATPALLFSAWLTYLEAYVIHAWCQWCVTSAILVTLIFLAAIPEWKRLGGGDA
jgi:uncharacterized membrane protein